MITLPALGAESIGPGRRNPSSLRLGVASYSTRMLSLDESIAILQALRLPHVGLFKTHCPWETATPGECQAIGARLRAAGIALTGSGVIRLPNDEAVARRAFENVRAAGMETMVCKPELSALPLLERLAREFDQKLAIHNHGPEDKDFPTPREIWDAIRPYDARIGLCIDVGHAARGGADPVADIRRFASRLHDLHLKDSLAEVGALKDTPCEIGAGRLDIRGMLAALLDINYSGVVALEYEKVSAHPVVGLAESAGYVRGLLASMA